MLFLIEGKIDMIGDNVIPAHEFGYSTITSIEYTNWYNDKVLHQYVVLNPLNGEFALTGELVNIVSVGSVEFCLSCYKQMGVGNISPLNIPQELWKFVKRKVGITNTENLSGHYFVKDTNKIKHNSNGEYSFYGNDIISLFEPKFYTKWVDNIVSEWRCFIFNGEILGIRCYSGNEWMLPDKRYIESIVKEYTDKKAYTLDVMVCDNGETDILELHDFFACGLYGFEHPKLLNMFIAKQKEVLKLKEE